MALVHYQDPDRKTQTPVSAENPLPVTMSGGGGGGGEVEVRNFPATQAVSGPLTDAELRASAVSVTGPLTNAQYQASIGTPAIAAWSGINNGTVIAILKALYAQNEQMITLLTEIRDNTAAE